MNRHELRSVAPVVQQELDARFRLWCMALSIGAVLLPIDFVLAGVAGAFRPYIFCILFGFVAAQVTLIAAWGAFSSSAFLVRFPHSLILTGIVVLTLAGASLPEKDVGIRPWSMMLFPAVVVTQILLGAVRSQSGWRFVLDIAGTEAGRRPLTLRHLLGQTVAFACFLAAARLIWQAESAAQASRHIGPNGNGQAFAAVMVYLVLISLAFLRMAFRFRLLVAFGISLLMTLVALGLEIGFLMAVFARPTDGQTVMVLFLTHATHWLTLTAVVGVMRSCGIVMVEHAEPGG